MQLIPIRFSWYRAKYVWTSGTMYFADATTDALVFSIHSKSEPEQTLFWRHRKALSKNRRHHFLQMQQWAISIADIALAEFELKIHFIRISNGESIFANLCSDSSCSSVQASGQVLEFSFENACCTQDTLLFRRTHIHCDFMIIIAGTHASEFMLRRSQHVAAAMCVVEC